MTSIGRSRRCYQDIAKDYAAASSRASNPEDREYYGQEAKNWQDKANSRPVNPYLSIEELREELAAAIDEGRTEDADSLQQAIDEYGGDQ